MKKDDSRKSINHKILPSQRVNIRAFIAKYTFIRHQDIADLFGVSRARISEIYRQDEARGGL